MSLEEDSRLMRCDGIPVMAFRNAYDVWRKGVKKMEIYD